MIHILQQSPFRAIIDPMLLQVIGKSMNSVAKDKVKWLKAKDSSLQNSKQQQINAFIPILLCLKTVNPHHMNFSLAPWDSGWEALDLNWAIRFHKVIVPWNLVEAHMKVSMYWLPDLVLGKWPTQSMMALLECVSRLLPRYPD